MEAQEIRAMLQYPDPELVQLALGRANLNVAEWETIKLREFECQTIEQTAEILDVSPMTVKNRYGRGMQKLDRCWSHIPWIDGVIKS